MKIRRRDLEKLKSAFHEARALADSLRTSPAQLTRAQADLQASAAALNLALDQLISQLDPGVPLALLPVRIETRFRTAAAGRELLIRIYPDDIHSSTHEPGLTSLETEFGQHFWQQWWRAGVQPDRQVQPDLWQAWRTTLEAAWYQLTQRFGAARALWIAGELRPTNPADQPTTPVPEPAALPVTPTFPNPDTRSRAWSRAARAECLPDRFVAIGVRGGTEIFRVWGEVVSDPLPIGPDPAEQQASATEPTDQAWYRWKTDFDAAVAVGLGIRVDANVVPADGRIDQLLVLGFSATHDADESARRLQSLLEGHRHTWGLDLIPQGTPTNNTAEARSTWKRSDGAFGDTLDQLFASAPAAESDAARLSSALGVAGDVFATVANSSAHDHTDAKAMNSVAWSTWWAYYCRRLLGDVFGGWDVREDTLVRWRQHFLDFVSARGPLSAVRVHNQPYGVLPASSLDDWTLADSRPDLLVLQPGEQGGDAVARIGWNLDMARGVDSWIEPLDIPTLRDDSTLRAMHLALAPNTESKTLLVIESGRKRAEPLTFRIGRDVDASITAQGGWTASGKVPAPKGTSTSFAACFGSASTSTEIWIASSRDEGSASVLTLTVGRTAGAPDWPAPKWQRIVDVSASLPAGTRVLSLCLCSFDEPERQDAIVLIAGAEISILVGRDLAEDGRAAGGWSKPQVVANAPQTAVSGLVSISGARNALFLDVVIADASPTGRIDESALFAVRGSIRTRLSSMRINWRAATSFVVPGLAPIAIASGLLGDSTQPSLTSESGLVNLLRVLRDAWRQSAANSPTSTLGDASTPDPEGAFLDLLASNATTCSAGVRSMLGPQMVSNLWRFMGSNIDRTALGNYVNSLEAQQGPTFARIGMPGNAWLARAAFADEITELSTALVQNDPLSETDPLGANYLSWLTTRDLSGHLHPDKVHERSYLADLKLDVPREPLLLKVARHALLNGYIDAALRQNVANAGDESRRGQLLGMPLGTASANIDAIDPEFIGLIDVIQDSAANQALPTRWEYLGTTEARTNLPMSEYLRADGRDAELDEVRSALQTLSLQPSAALDRLMSEALDLASHRLDAWITSLPTRRLQDMRRSRPTGIHVGAWGFVEHLAPATQPQSTGFVHAPSLAQATAAAVLRSAWLTHGGAQNANNPFAIDLSSARVRLALELIEGVREQQPLSALLGYRLERALHEHYPALALDRFIATLRARYPLVAGQLTATAANEPAESVAARNVADGLALVRDWGAGTFDPATLTGITSDELMAVRTELQRLTDALDCVNDLGVAESVYQAVNGRTGRAGASLDFLSKGTTRPPLIEVVDTPRTGVVAKHRVLIAIDSNTKAASNALEPWTQVSSEQAARQVRKAAEPALDLWVSAVLGAPNRVRWRVAHGEEGKETIVERTLLDLGLSALDSIYAAMASTPQVQSDLEALLLLDATRNAPAGASRTAIKILLDRHRKWSAEVLTLPEFLSAAAAVRNLVTEAVPASNIHFSAPGNTDTRWDLNDLSVRTRDAVDSLRAASDALKDQAEAAASSVALDDLRNALLDLWFFGVQGAVPESATGDDDSARGVLLRQADRTRKETSHRLASVDALLTEIDNSAAPVADDYLAVLGEVLGRGFRVLPRFQLADSQTFAQALTARQRASDATSAQVLQWFSRLTRVREPLARLDHALAMSECAGGVVSLGLEIAQLPLATTRADRWIANALPPGEKIPGGQVSIAVHHFDLPAPLESGATLAGLVVDQWDELIPNAQETTAVALHYDAPASAAPNVVLLAVPPSLGKHWTLDSLLHVVRETIDLAKLRAIDPDAVPGELAQLLPTSVLAFNGGAAGAGDTVSTAFRD
jgi:hypothetical protein